MRGMPERTIAAFTPCHSAAMAGRRAPLRATLVRYAVTSAVAFFAFSALAVAQEATAPAEPLPTFDQYDPPSTLVVPTHPVARARYPFIDVHNHQPQMPTQDLRELLTAMDELNMAVMVNLSGRGFRTIERPDGSRDYDVMADSHLVGSLANVEKTAPERFVVFTNLSFEGFGTPEWTGTAVRQLEADVAAGARGLKIYKSFGLTVLDQAGARVAVDDPRLDPVWKRCGELGIPVLIHTADPAPFWQPKDATNERLLELNERPERWWAGRDAPPWEQLIAEQTNLFRRHPGTRFIAAHLMWMGNDLGRLGRLLDELPNVSTEIGAVLAELGRQPRAAREFFVRYQDRILFGKDSWNASEYPYYFRVLETADEYFDYYRRRHAFWKLYGLDLPDEVLRKVYYGNALRIIPGLDASRFPPLAGSPAAASSGS
jgi:predicted TIM-barrel fold metal-dependent hydrolase